MTTAAQRGWGNPDSSGYRQNNIVQVVAGGVTLYVRKEVAHLFAGFCDELVARGYPLNGIADDWGYNNRDIRGRPGVKSNHAWGLAVDLNSTNNPMTSDGRVHTDMPDWVGEAADYWHLFWGAKYSGSRKDPMHFEYLGTPNDVPHPAPRTGPTPPPAPPQPAEDDDMLRIVKCNEHPGPMYLTNGIDQVRTLTPEALIHGRNLGVYPHDELAVPHAWITWVDSNQDGHNNPDGA